MLADQWNKSASSMIFLLRTGFSLDDSNQTLRLARFAHWNDQPTTNFELGHQRTRNRRAAGCHKYRVVWRVCRPAQCAIKTLHRSVVDV